MLYVCYFQCNSIAYKMEEEKNIKENYLEAYQCDECGVDGIIYSHNWSSHILNYYDDNVPWVCVCVLCVRKMLKLDFLKESRKQYNQMSRVSVLIVLCEKYFRIFFTLGVMTTFEECTNKKLKGRTQQYKWDRSKVAKVQLATKEEEEEEKTKSTINGPKRTSVCTRRFRFPFCLLLKLGTNQRTKFTTF